MVDVKNLLRKSRSNWLSAEEVKIGDRLEILGDGEIDSKTFDHPYLILPVKLLRTGEEKKLRLGVRNISRLTQSFGTSNTSEWVGRIVEVVSIEDYPRFGKKGLILRGLPKQSVQTAIQLEHQFQVNEK